MLEAVNDVAQIARRCGGRALLVGGCVRDMLRGDASPKDFDFEVFGIEPAALKNALADRFALDEVGASFGVLKLHHYDIDVAMPRRETKLGLGHKAFATDCEANLSIEEASARRDFTINAIYHDPLTGETLDPWNGRDDLKRGILRHVSDHFREDPLRVLRGMQFAARFSLEAAPETVQICREMEPEGLPPERQFEEWRKLLVKGVAISKGLEFLRQTGWVRYYPELAALIGCEQAPEWHPEGDVWQHTLCALDAFAKKRTVANAGEDEDVIVGLAVLCHDFGKPATSFFDKAKGRIRALGHDVAGVAPTRSFLKRLTAEERILKAVPPLVRLHMRPHSMWKSKAGENAVRRLAAEVGRIDRLLRVCAADDEGRPPLAPTPEALNWLEGESDRLAVKDSSPKPLLLGRDLIALGLTPSPDFGPILRSAYEYQLDGIVRTREESIAHLAEYMLSPLASKTMLIWDWNGTLLDDTLAALDTLNTMLVKRGAKTISMPFYLDHFAFPVRPFYEKIGMVLEHEDWDALAQEYHDIYHLQPKRLNANALEAIALAHRLGFSQTIVSALRQDLLVRDTRRFGVFEHMHGVIGVDNLDGASKRDLAIRAVERFRKEKPHISRYIIIGDSLHDREVADAIGAECILCACGSHAAWRLERAAPIARDLVEAVRYAATPRRRAIVSLGSNIEPRRDYIEKAIEALSHFPATHLTAKSELLETEGVDVPQEFAHMKFLNSIAVFDTHLEPLDFSRRIHEVEDALGRIRSIRNGPRTIDIDLIDFGGVRMDTPELTLPHPRASSRDFVMSPLNSLGLTL